MNKIIAEENGDKHKKVEEKDTNVDKTENAKVDKIKESKVDEINEPKVGEIKDTKVEEIKEVDPSNQAQISMLTDDNSIAESEKSDLNLNYSDEVKASEENTVTQGAPMETGMNISLYICLFIFEYYTIRLFTIPRKDFFRKREGRFLANLLSFRIKHGKFFKYTPFIFKYI